MKLKRLLVIALSMMMVLGMSVNVFATEGAITGEHKKVALTKELDVAQGLAVPTEAFKFGVKKGTTNETYTGEAEYVSDTKKYADLSFADISFTEAERGTTTPEKLVKESTVDLTNASFGSAGLFVYEVTETAGNTTGMTYDNKTYYVKVYVKNSANGPVVDQVGVSDGTEKKNADPQAENPGDNQLVDETKETKGEFRFVNAYTKEVTTNPDPENTSGAFHLKKIISGDFADKTKAYAFAIKVTLPSTAPDNYQLAATANNNAVSFTGTGKEKTATVNLADSQLLNFASLPAGTKIEFTETKVTHYAQSFVGKAAADISGGDATAYDAAQLAAFTVTVGQEGAYVNYTNTFNPKEVSETGIVINNLPYILLIAIALGGIVLFARKRRYDR